MLAQSHFWVGSVSVPARMTPSRFSSGSAWLNRPTVSMKMPRNTVVALAPTISTA